MNNYTHAFFDAKTGQTTIVDFTQAEIELVQAEAAAQQQVAADAAAARASALAKLKALGLTDAEVAALVGG